MAIDFHDLDHDLVADLDHVFDLLDALRRELRDVDEAFFARQERDERTEVHQARDRAEIRFADLHFFGQRFDHRFGLLGAFAVGRRDEHAAVVLDVDLDTGVGDDLVDDLAAGTDHVFDLVRVDR